MNNARKNLPVDKLAVAERIKIFLNSPSETSRFWIRPRSCHRNNLVTEKLCLLCCGHPCCGDFAHSEFAPSTVTIPGMTYGVSHLLLPGTSPLPVSHPPGTSHLTGVPSTRGTPHGYSNNNSSFYSVVCTSMEAQQVLNILTLILSFVALVQSFSTQTELLPLPGKTLSWVVLLSVCCITWHGFVMYICHV